MFVVRLADDACLTVRGTLIVAGCKLFQTKNAPSARANSNSVAEPMPPTPMTMASKVAVVMMAALS